MRNAEPDELDRALENALARYSSVEPVAGLEQRVLNRVRAEGAAPRIGRLGFGGWALAVGMLAGMAVGAVWWIRPVLHGAGEYPARVPAARAAEPAPQRAPWTAGGRPVRKRATPRTLAKRHEFPTPAPVSREERALLAFAEFAPDALREAFTAKDAPPVEPIRIEEIKVEPLQSDGLR